MHEPLIATVALVFFGALRVFAQAPPAQADLPLNGLGTVVSSVGIVGVLIWHLWYITTHTHPQMLKDFALELAKLRDDREEERAAAAKETAELRAMFIQHLQSMRTAVHDVKDTAQTAINKVALEKLQRDQKRHDAANGGEAAT